VGIYLKTEFSIKLSEAVHQVLQFNPCNKRCTRLYLCQCMQELKTTDLCH